MTLKAVSDSMVKANDANTDEQVGQDRVLKAVVRVGNLAKHLLLKSDNQVSEGINVYQIEIWKKTLFRLIWL
jgi:hypothetical protein